MTIFNGKPIDIHELNNPIQSTTYFAHFIYQLLHFRVFLQYRCMMRFYAGINNQRAITAPVLMLGKIIYAINIMRWIAAGKGYPYKVVDVLRGKGGIVT